MTVPYRAHVDERTLLNLPGFHSGAFVYIYVEDTSERGLQYGEYCEPGCLCGCVDNFEPHMRLEISDCDERVELVERVLAVPLAVDVESERDAPVAV